MPADAQPDFGKAGKITIRKDKIGVGVDLGAGQYLFYRLTVKGAEPFFAWACEHDTRLTAGDFEGHPMRVYEWTWCRGGASDKDADDDVYSVEMRFTAATKYTLFVEVRDVNNASVKTVKDLDFESQAPQDFFVSTLRVFVD
jgi:hypothetical protein